MNEKVLIKSESYNVKKFFVILVLIGLVLSVILHIAYAMELGDSYDDSYSTYKSHLLDDDCGWRGGKCWECREIDGSSKIGYIFSGLFEMDMFLIYSVPLVAFALIGGLIYLWLRSYELTITDKRAFGKVAWGKRVDLPVDSISATATGAMKGISISTSSGKISFLLIKNAEAIYKVVSDLIIERQQTKNTVAAPAAALSDSADQLAKYKALLDSGVITKEEFEAKKKQLLGL